MDPTPTQIFSLSLSLFSIAAKAFQLCRSWNIAGFFAKMSFVIHDLFSLAFISSAVFLASVPTDTTFSFFGIFGEIPVTNLTWWWMFIKVFCCLCLFTAYSLIYLEDVWFRDYASQSKIKDTLLFFGLLVLGSVPVAIVHEGLKLSYLFLLGLYVEPNASNFPNVKLLDSFLMSSSGNKRIELIDWNRTFSNIRKSLKEAVPLRSSLSGSYNYFAGDTGKHVCNFRILFPKCQVVRDLVDEHENEGDDKNAEFDNLLLRAKYCLFYRTCRRFQKLVTNDAYSVSNKDLQDWLRDEHQSFGETQQRLFNNPLRGKTGDRLNKWSTFLYEMYRLWDPFSHYRKESVTWLDWNIMLPSRSNPQSTTTTSFSRKRDVIEPLVITLTMTSFALTGVTGLVFPLLHFFYYFQYWTLIQYITFAPTVLALLSSLALFKFALHYLFVSMISDLCQLKEKSPILAVIDLYNSVPLPILRKFAVGSDKVIPSECFERHVSPFLTSELVGLKGVRQNELEKIMGELTKLDSEKKRK